MFELDGGVQDLVLSDFLLKVRRTDWRSDMPGEWRITGRRSTAQEVDMESILLSSPASSPESPGLEAYSEMAGVTTATPGD